MRCMLVVMHAWVYQNAFFTPVNFGATKLYGAGKRLVCHKDSVELSLIMTNFKLEPGCYL